MVKTNKNDWEMIVEAAREIYGTQEPKHYGSLTDQRKDPVERILAYKAENPFPHWHLITFGLSKANAKGKNGYGFELTFRPIREADEEEPPVWSLHLLLNIARYVYASKNTFQYGDYLDVHEPLCPETDTKLTALAFLNDPELKMPKTSNGKVRSVQMVGITAKELEAIQTWNSLGFLGISQQYLPQHVTDLDRKCLLDDEAVERAIEYGIEEDGSSTGLLYVDSLQWEAPTKKFFGKNPAVLTIGKKTATVVKKLLRGRLLKNRPLTLSSPEVKVSFLIGGDSHYLVKGSSIEITLNEWLIIQFINELQANKSEIEVKTEEPFILRIV